jgi:hypothetical protein
MDSPPAVPKRCHLVGSYIHIALDHLLSKLETSRFRPSQWRGLLTGLSRKSRCVGREPITLFSLRVHSKERLFARPKEEIFRDLAGESHVRGILNHQAKLSRLQCVTRG